MKSLTRIFSLLLLLTLLVACDEGAASTLHGGQILDSELMSEIRAEVFATGTMPEETQATEGETVTVPEGQFAVAIVYWTSGGSVWHADRECRHFKESSVILSGTIEESGKDKACSACGDQRLDTQLLTEEITEIISASETAVETEPLSETAPDTETVPETEAHIETETATEAKAQETTELQTALETESTSIQEDITVFQEHSTDNQTEAAAETESEASVKTDIEGTEEQEGTVYWLKTGEVWHIKRDCSYIRNKEVFSGTVEEAMADKKTRICSRCGK